MQDLTPAEIEALSKAMGSPYTGQINPLNNPVYNRNAARVYLPPLKETNEPMDTVQAISKAPLQAQVRIDAIFGKARLSIADLLEVKPGSVIKLDNLAGELVDLEINGTAFARGEVVVVDDHFAIRIIESYNT